MDRYLVESYFNWLRSDCFNTATEARTYEGVLRELHDTPFYWTIWSDENRSGDALSFRQFEFLDCFQGKEQMDQVLLGQWATAAPSVLEVMLGIARRWAFYFGGGSVAFYFNHLFKNMGFDRYPARVLNSTQRTQVRNKVDVWLSRTFNANGLGSPFPVGQNFNKGPDYRNVDIWGQMNAYSAEHFQ